MLIKKRKGNILIYTLLILVLLSIIVMELRVARLNLTENIMSSKTMHNADVATQVMIDDANRSMNDEFYAKTFDYKVDDVYLQAEYTPISLKEADNMNRPYSLDSNDIQLKFSQIDNNLSNITISYPNFGTDYLNYFIVDDTNNLYSNRINSTYLSKAQVLKKYTPTLSGSSKPLIYKNDILNRQYSYDINGSNLKKALYVDMIENSDIYNIKYPLYEKGINKTIDNTKYTVSDIAVPTNFKEMYIVFCNEDKALPTGLFASNYGYSTDIITNDVRDSIRLNYSYIRIFKDLNNFYIENSLPVYEEGFQYSTTVNSDSNIRITNMKANLDKSINSIQVSQYSLDTITGSSSLSDLSDTVNTVMGTISLALGNRARQLIATDKLPNDITYTLKTPATRQYKLSYRIFNSKNILIKKREYILDMR